MEPTYIENSPSIRTSCSFTEIYIVCVVVGTFAHLETSGNRSRQTKDDAQRIGDYK